MRTRTPLLAAATVIVVAMVALVVMLQGDASPAQAEGPAISLGAQGNIDCDGDSLPDGKPGVPKPSKCSATFLPGDPKASEFQLTVNANLLPSPSEVYGGFRSQVLLGGLTYNQDTCPAEVVWPDLGPGSNCGRDILLGGQLIQHTGTTSLSLPHPASEEVGTLLKLNVHCPDVGTFKVTLPAGNPTSVLGTSFRDLAGTLVFVKPVGAQEVDLDGDQNLELVDMADALVINCDPAPPVPYPCPVNPNLAFPDPGCDAYPASGTLFAGITDPAVVSLECNVNGPITVARFQNPLTPNDTPPGNGLRDFQTEILSMELAGFCEPGGFEIIIRQSQANPSLGLVEEQVTGGSFFPADSFYDVFFEIESIDLGRTLTNSTSVLLECKLTAIPTGNCDFVMNLGGGAAAGGAGCALFDGITPVGKCTAVTVPSGSTDSDLDGCSDAAESQTAAGSEMTGGLRGERNQWDFLDVNGDKNIDVPNDILQVIFAYLQGPLDAGGPGLNYSTTKDRGPAITGALYPWQRTGPDGHIDVPNDILPAIFQYLHSCK